MSIRQASLVIMRHAPNAVQPTSHAAMTRTAAERLTMEITESALGSDPFHTAKCVNDLRAKGVRMAIDDYGVGYSSMSQPLKLEIDELKVDTSFIIGLANDTRAQAIVRSAIELAHALGLSLVAEGIEEVAVLALLQEFGADVGQGVYIAPPLWSNELDDFLARRASGVDGDQRSAPVRHL